MEKTAQKRNLRHKFRELVNLPTRSLKKVFDPQYKELIENLQKTDDQIRAIASGEVIGSADPGIDPISTKKLLKEARSKFIRREYLVVASLLGRFHQKIEEINKTIDNFKLDFESVHNRFLFAPLEDVKEKDRDKHIEHLRNLRQRLGTPQNNSFIKEAGVWDMIHNLYSRRGRALAAWEKQYPEKVQALRRAAEESLNKAESLQNKLLTLLKEMGTARAVGNLNEYVKLVKNINKISTDFDSSFKTFYN